MRIEYTNNHVAGAPNVFYTHSLYQSGYTYKGRVIGHHIGTDASDLFIRVSHYIRDDVVVGLEFDRETIGLSSSHQTTNKLGFDLSFLNLKNWQLVGGYRYEDSDKFPTNHIFYFDLIYNF